MIVTPFAPAASRPAPHRRAVRRADAMTGTPHALLYRRVSSDEQAREGVSLDAQHAEVWRYAAERQWVIAGEYQDVLKGTRDDRPDYQRLLSDVRRMHAEGKNVVVIVAALDRLGRRVLERVRAREELKALGV
ncbi:MAG TPA: recombinase family protein, partial [Chloroflexota bacterium]|nr:recombinase family protein [Chloroflexota bacterium]